MITRIKKKEEEAQTIEENWMSLKRRNSRSSLVDDLGDSDSKYLLPFVWKANIGDDGTV